MPTRTYDLTHRVTIQYDAKAGQPDSNYERQAPNWTRLATVYAQRRGLKGSLFFSAAMADHEDDEQFIIYWRADVQAYGAGMLRFIDGPVDDRGEPAAGAQVFMLKLPPIDPDGTRMWLECHCRRVIANAG